MAKMLITKSLLTSIADAIRSKTGKTDTMTPAEMATEIESISGGGSSTRGISEDEWAKAVSSQPFKVVDNITTTAKGYFTSNLDCWQNITSATFYQLTSIPIYWMHYAKKLQRVILPKCTSVGRECFWYCTSLKYVEILGNASGSMPYLCRNATDLCNLIAFVIRTTDGVQAIENAASKTFGASGAIVSGTGYVYVPSSLIDSYKTATNWSSIADQFRAIEDYTVDGTLTGDMDYDKMGVTFDD